MIFERLYIPEIVLCKPKVFEDKRGYFLESFRKDKLEEFLGYSINFCQDNESKSNKYVLRGLHYQSSPYAQSKMVRVIKGAVMDVVVDIRIGSPTFGRYIKFELSEENKYQLFIPRGFAHGFLVLKDETIFAYKVDNYYSPVHDRGIAFNDRDLGINWGVDVSKLKISDKDKRQPSLKDSDSLFKYGVDYYSDEYWIINNE